jgi:hypothetical protein
MLLSSTDQLICARRRENRMIYPFFKSTLAHNRLALVRSDSKAEFEIAPDLQNQPVLFDFVEPGDILHLLWSVHLCLVRMGNGDPLRP